MASNLIDGVLYYDSAEKAKEFILGNLDVAKDTMESLIDKGVHINPVADPNFFSSIRFSLYPSKRTAIAATSKSWPRSPKLTKLSSAVKINALKEYVNEDKLPSLDEKLEIAESTSLSQNQDCKEINNKDNLDR